MARDDRATKVCASCLSPLPRNRGVYCSVECRKEDHKYIRSRMKYVTDLPEYKIWSGMKRRCFKANSPGFEDYGGRGITVCERWKNSFEAFYSDMGPRPSSRHSIDRFPDNDGNYEPGNCRWATSFEQGRNKRNNRLIEANGEVLTASEWAERLGVDKNQLYSRLNHHGWDPRDAVTRVPIRRPSNVGRCKRGHEWTASNWYIRPDNGTKLCLTCARSRGKQRHVDEHDLCQCGSRKKKNSRTCFPCYQRSRSKRVMAQ